MSTMVLDSGAPLLRLQLLGYMHFPNDELLRDALVLTATARAASMAKEALVLSPDEAGAISNSPGYDQFSKLIPKAAQQGGIIAGETLISFLRMHASNSSTAKPSLGKAQYLVGKDISPRKLASEGRLPRSDRSLRNSWLEFKRVAHFWAARQLSLESKMRECDLADHPRAFLSLAVALFEMAANSAVRNQPLLDADTWLPAPGISAPLSVTIEPLSPPLIESLEIYE